MAHLLTRCTVGIAAAAVLGFAAVASCTATTPVPSTGPHTGSDRPMQVPKPPPEPVRVEFIGDQPEAGTVWIDGHWHWSARRWVWRPGTWAWPPSEGYYAPPALVRIPVPVYEGDAGTNRTLRGYGMTLMYLPGHFHVPDGGIVEVDPIGGGDGGERTRPASSAP